MKNLSFLMILIAVLFFSGCSDQNLPTDISAAKTPVDVKPVQNDWLFADLIAQVNGLTDPQEQSALVDSFMAIAAVNGIPVTEDTLCYFIYRGNPGGNVQVAGDFTGWSPDNEAFTRLATTNLYYLQRTFPADSRLDYKLVVNGGWILDPLNPHTISGGFGPNSELSMPDYVQPWEIEYDPNIAHGTLVSFNYTSSITNNTRTIQVLLPAGYGLDTLHYPTIYVNDGGEYVSLASMRNTVDNLIAAQKIEPVIAVFVDPVDRMTEYWMNDQYAEMIATELVPYIEVRYRSRQSAQYRGIMGASLGGLISLYTGYKYPDIFGHVGGQSSSIWVDNQAMINLYNSSPMLPLHLYLDWGTFENIYNEHYAFVAILNSKGYPFAQYEYNEGHSWGSWRAHVDDILISFWPLQVTGI